MISEIQLLKIITAILLLHVIMDDIFFFPAITRRILALENKTKNI